MIREEHESELEQQEQQQRMVLLLSVLDVLPLQAEQQPVGTGDDQEAVSVSDIDRRSLQVSRFVEDFIATYGKSSVLVCLLSVEELEQLQLMSLFDATHAIGCTLLFIPWWRGPKQLNDDDRSTTATGEADAQQQQQHDRIEDDMFESATILVRELAERFTSGENVAILGHTGDWHRVGLLAACVLIDLGFSYSVEYALHCVQRAAYEHHRHAMAEQQQQQQQQQIDTDSTEHDRAASSAASTSSEPLRGCLEPCPRECVRFLRRYHAYRTHSMSFDTAMQDVARVRRLVRHLKLLDAIEITDHASPKDDDGDDDDRARSIESDACSLTFATRTLFDTMPMLLALVLPLSNLERFRMLISDALPSIVTLLRVGDVQLQPTALAILRNLLPNDNVCEMALALDAVPATLTALSACLDSITSPPSTDASSSIKVGLDCLLLLMTHDQTRTLVEMELVALPLVTKIAAKFAHELRTLDANATSEIMAMIPLDALNTLAALAKSRQNTQLCLQDATTFKLLVELLSFAPPSTASEPAHAADAAPSSAAHPSGSSSSSSSTSSTRSASDLDYELQIRLATLECIRELVHGDNDATRKEFCRYSTIQVLVEHLRSRAIQEQEQLFVLQTLVSLASCTPEVQDAFRDSRCIEALIEELANRFADASTQRYRIQLALAALTKVLSKSPANQQLLVSMQLDEHQSAAGTPRQRCNGVEVLSQLCTVLGSVSSETEHVWLALLECLEVLCEPNAASEALDACATSKVIAHFSTLFFQPMTRSAETCREFEQLLVTSLSIVENLASYNREMQDEACNQGVLAACLDMVVRGVELEFPDSTLRSAVCAVYAISYAHAANMVMVERAGALTALVSLLSSPVATVIDAALLALDNMLAHASNEATFTTVFEADINPALALLLSSTARQLQIKAAHCISHLAKGADTDANRRAMLRRNNNIPLLVQCLHSSHKQLVAEIAEALGCIVDGAPSLQRDAKRAGAISLLVDRLRIQLPRKRAVAGGKLQAVHVASLKALAALVHNNESIQRAAVRRNAVDVAIVHLLEDCEVVLPYACLMLTNMAAGGERMQDAVRLAGERLGDTLFQRLLELVQHPNIEVANAAITTVVSLITNHSTSWEERSSVPKSETDGACCFAARNKNLLRDLDGIRILQQLVDDGSDAIKPNARVALEHLLSE